MKVTRGFLMLAVVMVLAVAANASAYTTVMGTDGWQTWSAADVDQNGNPYWDGNSTDSTGLHGIGSYLTNSGDFSGGTAGPGAIPYWGQINSEWWRL